MATLAEIRQKYPQYEDMSDEQFAQAFHKKFYADMPFDEFSQKLGYKTEKKSPAGWNYDAYLKQYEEDAARPQVPGHILPPKKTKEEFDKEKNSDYIDKILGVPESLLTLGTGMFAALNAVPGAVIKGIKEGSTDAMEKEFNRLSEEKTWTPRTEYGGKLASNLAYGLQAFGPLPYVMRPALRGQKAPIPKLTVEERLAQAEAQRASEQPAAATVDTGKGPIDFVAPDMTELVPKTETPFRYEGGIDAPELLGPENIKKTFDPRLEAEQAANKQALLDVEAMKTIDPEAVAEMRRADPAAPDAAFNALEQEAARKKKLEKQAAWAMREESAVERAKERGRQADMEETLYQIQDDLNKGLRGKQHGAIDPELLSLGFTKLFHGGREFSKWDPRTIGKGEGMMALGPGLYAADTPVLAELYKKYGNSVDFDDAGNMVVTPGVLNELAVNTKNIHNYRESSPKWQKAIDNLDALGYKASSRGIQSALQHAHQFGESNAARKAMTDAGIDGMYVDLGGNLGKEIVIFNPDIIAQVSRADTPVEKFNRGPAGKQRGAILWQGSPFKWDEDVPKARFIGSGEGAAGYGHGLYWTDVPEIGAKYKESTTANYKAREIFSKSNLIDTLEARLDRDRKAVRGQVRLTSDEKLAIFDQLKQLKEEVKKAEAKINPSLYKVHYPDERISKMIRWEAPLKEQPELVQKLFNDSGATSFQQWLRTKEAAKILKENDIPGITYPTGEARSGNRTERNYVTFPDEEVNITTLERNPSLNSGMARGQRGGLDFKYMGDTLDQKRQKIADLLGTKMFTPKPSAESVVQAALAEGKDGKGFNSLQSGATLTAMKRDSALITGVSRIMQHEVNKADLDIREKIFPAEKSLRKLPRKELEPLMKVFLSEARTKIKYTAEQLADFGLSVEQLAAYTEVRRMFGEVLRIENEARELQGKKPVTELEYYSSARWHGDFRQDFADASGKHVWSLAGTSARDLKKQREALLKQFPDLVPSKERTVRHGKGDLDPVALYKGMLDILGEDDAAVARIKEWYETTIGAEVGNTLAQEKHFKTKAGVRGFVGDRPGRSGVSEALDFFQQQIQYAKNGVRWSAMQRAGADIKTILSNENLQTQQPNNVAYARDYLRHNLGFSEAKAVAAMEDSLRNLGLSPTQMSEAVGTVKSAWVTQKLVASPGFMLSNLVQSTAVLPHMMNIMTTYGGNPLVGLTGGMLGIAQLGAGHLMGLGGAHFVRGRKAMMMMSTDFYNQAMKYAEDNGVTSRSTYDESPIKSAFNPIARGVDLAAKATITTPETFLRAFAFTAFASQLESSGKFKNNLEIFRKAEELTNVALGDYRAGERPMVFAKMGMAGDIAGTLSTFPMNYYNQWNWAGREALKGNVAPALTMFVVQAYIAGAMGVPGFQDLDKAFELIKSWAAENNPKLWKQIKDWSPKQLVMDYLGEDALYGNASTKTNLALTSRVAAPSITDMVGMPGGMAVDIAKQAGNIAGAVTNPNERSVAKAIMGSAPVGLQGALETQVFRDTVSRPTPDGQLYMKRNTPTPEGDFVRTPEDETARAWGLRTQRESLTKDETYRLQQRSFQAREATNASFDKFYNAARTGKMDEAKTYAKLYTELTGKGITNKQIEAHIVKEYTSGTQKALTAAKQLEAMKAAKRMMEIINE